MLIVRGNIKGQTASEIIAENQRLKMRLETTKVRLEQVERELAAARSRMMMAGGFSSSGRLDKSRGK